MKIQVILATDILSRGIDLPDVRYVVNFDMPLSQAEFFHRIGRSGRFGSLGAALSFITPQEMSQLAYVRPLCCDGGSMEKFVRIEDIQQLGGDLLVSSRLRKE
jgi:ATP-dependent RNA helicase RhlE